MAVTKQGAAVVRFVCDAAEGNFVFERWCCRGLCLQSLGGVPPSGVRAEGVGFAVEALQGLHGGRDQEVIGELR